MRALAGRSPRLRHVPRGIRPRVGAPRPPKPRIRRKRRWPTVLAVLTAAIAIWILWPVAVEQPDGPRTSPSKVAGSRAEGGRPEKPQTARPVTAAAAAAEDSGGVTCIPCAPRTPACGDTSARSFAPTLCSGRCRRAARSGAAACPAQRPGKVCRVSRRAPCARGARLRAADRHRLELPGRRAASRSRVVRHTRAQPRRVASAVTGAVRPS